MYNILLVEDDKNIREMLVEYFSKRDKEKFNITLAENGLKGLDKAYENSYDLLLLDVMLPEMDGFTLCKEIRRYSDVPIMFITARTSEADMPYDGSPESKEYYDETYFYPEFKGLEVTVKDKITGKTYTKTFDGTEEDMVYISPVYVRPDDTMTNLEVDVMGDVNEWLNLPEDEEYSTEVTGTFKVNYYANGVPSKDISSTKDTATKDTVTKSATGGNGAVQTGNPITAVSVALVMLVASGAMFVCYRRKIEK